MASRKTLPQVPPARKTQRQPATPTPTTQERLAVLQNEMRQLKREELHLMSLHHSGGVAPAKLPEITLTSEETQATAEFLYWTEGLLFAAQNATSTLRGVMEIVQNEAESMGLGGPKGKHGVVDVWNSYSPLYGAVETLVLLTNQLIAISNRADLAEMKLPDRLRETKKAAGELFASDFGE